MNRLKKEFETFWDLVYPNRKGEQIGTIWNWFNQNYISKKELIKQISELQEEPTRQGFLDIINKL